MTPKRTVLLYLLLGAALAVFAACVAHASGQAQGAADVATDLGAPAEPTTPGWHQSLVRMLPWLVLGAWGVLVGIMRLARWRPSWARLGRVCAWLRVGRRQAHLASLAAALFVVVPAAAEWTVRPGDVANAVGTWLLARNMPGGMEPAPERKAEGEAVTA